MQATPAETAYLRLVRRTPAGEITTHVAAIRRDLLARYGAGYLGHLSGDGAELYFVEPDADPAAPGYLHPAPAAAAAAELRAAGLAVYRSGLPVPVQGAVPERDAFVNEARGEAR